MYVHTLFCKYVWLDVLMLICQQSFFDFLIQTCLMSKIFRQFFNCFDVYWHKTSLFWLFRCLLKQNLVILIVSMFADAKPRYFDAQLYSNNITLVW